MFENLLLNNINKKIKIEKNSYRPIHAKAKRQMSLKHKQPTIYTLNSTKVYIMYKIKNIYMYYVYALNLKFHHAANTVEFPGSRNVKLYIGSFVEITY